MNPYTCVYSTMIRAGRTTYFVEVNESEEKERSLSIRQTTKGDRKRPTIHVEAESVVQFCLAISEARSCVPV